MIYVYPLLVLAGLFFVFGGGYKTTAVFGGSIWGIRVPVSKRQKIWKAVNVILLLAGFIVFVSFLGMAIGSLIQLLFSGLGGLIYVLAFVIGFFVVAIVSVKLALRELSRGKITANDTNALVLGNLPIIQNVEAQLSQASAFVVTADGIGLINAQNYCFAAELYNDYQLGTLTSAKEVALVGMYFVQKYHDQFNYKVDFERTYYPGETITFIGSGGVYVGHTKSRIESQFKSYIFYRI